MRGRDHPFELGGTFNIRYDCYSGYGILPWGFKLSPAVQAIVVGNVNEDGLRWWRDGVSQAKNSPHVEAALDTGIR